MEAMVTWRAAITALEVDTCDFDINARGVIFPASGTTAVAFQRRNSVAEARHDNQGKP